MNDNNYIPTGYPQQQNMPVSSDEIYANTMQEDRVKNLIEQISPDNQLMDLQWRIKGYIKDPVTREWRKLDKDAPEPSSLLVARYVSYLSSILNQNTTLSNLSSSEINSMMKLCIEWLVDDLETNAEIYNLKGQYSELTRIGQLILNNTFMVLKRSQNGMESRRIFNTLQIHEGLNQGQQKKGLMEALKFWK